MSIARALLEDMSNNWWVILLRGIVGVIFGVIAFVSPGATLLALVFVWGAYALIDGAFALYMTYLAGRQQRRWWPYLLEGLAGIGAGILTFVLPGITALVLLYLIAAWAIVTGIVEIVAAIDLRKQIQNEWLLGLAGVLSIIFGIIVAIMPDAGALAVVWTVGAYALLFGITLIVLAFRVRSLGKSHGASGRRLIGVPIPDESVAYSNAMSSFREIMTGLLGRRLEPAPLAAQVEERVDLGDVVRERISYAVEPGERVPAYLFVPGDVRPGDRRAGVFAHHQHAGQFHLGKSEVAGLAGNPEQAYALELARRGYVVLAPDAICFEERSPYNGSLDTPLEPAAGRDFERFEFTRRVLYGSCLQTKMVWDMQRGLDYLESRPDVNPARLGCIGHSLGGQQALFLAALDERVRVAVSSCGFASMKAVLRDGINHNFGAYVPGWLEHGDVGELLAEVAPRAFLALNGATDRIFPIDGLHDSYAVARRAYDAAGCGERLDLGIYPGGHGFTDEMRSRAYAWLDRWLRG